MQEVNCRFSLRFEARGNGNRARFQRRNEIRESWGKIVILLAVVDILAHESPGGIFTCWAIHFGVLLNALWVFRSWKKGNGDRAGISEFEFRIPEIQEI